MKNWFLRTFLMLGLIVFVASACKDKDAEKKIAELESRLAEEQSKSAQKSVVNANPTQDAEVKPDGPLPAMQFETMDHDFGTIKEGSIVEYTYTFKNTGTAPLIIQGAQGSCGCTVPTWPKEPVPVGGTGVITAKFDSNGKQNLQNKTVTITANTFPKQTVLKFKAMVTPKASSDMGPVKK
jgi:hypothetical protein